MQPRTAPLHSSQTGRGLSWVAKLQKSVTADFALLQKNVIPGRDVSRTSTSPEGACA